MVGSGCNKEAPSAGVGLVPEIGYKEELFCAWVDAHARETHS